MDRFFRVLAVVWMVGFAGHAGAAAGGNDTAILLAGSALKPQYLVGTVAMLLITLWGLGRLGRTEPDTAPDQLDESMDDTELHDEPDDEADEDTRDDP